MIVIHAKGSQQALEEKLLAILRREKLDAEQFTFSSQSCFRFSDLVIDGRSGQVTRNGEAIFLTRNEFHLLLFLAANAGSVCSKEELFRAVWGADSMDTRKVVANTVSNLRKKLKSSGENAAYIRTVRDGYVLGEDA